MDYGPEFYALMQKLNTTTAQEINRRRWDLIANVPHTLVLDYGCGLNFLTEYAPPGVTVDSFDIGHLNGEPYPQTGILHDQYDVVALFDVLEHVDWENAPDTHVLETIAAVSAVAVTVPIQPGDVPLERNWKHFKPGEHLTYFSVESLKRFFFKLGFACLIHDQRECPPREDVHSFLFARGK
jgi:hypothetical protein